MLPLVTPDLIFEHFKYCPRCAGQALASASGLENSVHCADCDFTLYFNPTCSAAALIEDDKGRLLVIERAKDPAKGKYGVPGGFTDAEERLEEVVAREVLEEVNLRPSRFEFFASFPNDYHYKSIRYQVVDTYFIGHVHSFDELQAETSEVAGIHFVHPEEVPMDQWAFSSLKKAIQHLIATKRMRGCSTGSETLQDFHER